MSVIIKGMDMPESCFWDCPYADSDPCGPPSCFALNKDGRQMEENIDVYEHSRPDWCPLQALPKTKGRLIDADEFVSKLIARVPDLRSISTKTIGQALSDCQTYFSEKEA